MHARNGTLSRLIHAWGRVLGGRRPLLSIEITRECPLHCPGCYAYEPQHLGAAGSLAQLGDYKGDALVEKALDLVRRHRPVFLSIVGGEPLVRYRELEILLPRLDALGVDVQLVTSAVRPIPMAWNRLANLHLVVSVDGLQPEHDKRRAPATYDRILKHIAGHSLIVHCTVTRQQARRPGYLEEFAAFWSGREEVRKIWFSLYTPQQGEQSEERLTPPDRARVVAELARIRRIFSKVDIPPGVLETYLCPPSSPDQCVFSQMTACYSADLSTRVTPCQFGGRPVCSECGCLASAGLAAIARVKLAGFIPVGGIYSASRKLGERFAGP